MRPVAILRRIKRLINHYFWHDKLIFVNFLIALIINLINWLFLVLKLKDLEDIIPLHYNVYFGIDMIGAKSELFKIPALGLLIFIINVILAFRIYKHERVNAYFLVIANSLIQAFLILSAFLIINL